MRATISLLLLFVLTGLNAEWTIVSSYELYDAASGLAWDGTWLYAGVYGVNGGNIYRIDPSNGAYTLQCTGPQDDSYGLTWDGSNLWYTDHPGSTSTPANAYQINLSGVLQQQFALPDHYMSGIAYDDGDFWVTTYYDPDGHIYKVDNTGAILQQFAAPDNQPWDLCMEGDNLWMADYWGDALYKIDTTTGSVIESQASESVDPSGVVFDGTYLWYIDNGGAGTTDWLYKVDLGGAGTPAITVGYETIEFGEVTVGQPASFELPITNNGSADLVVSDIDGGLEAFWADETLPLTITPGQTVNATIVFNPSSIGPYTSMLTITSNDPVHPQVTVDLSGYGLQGSPSIFVTPGSLAYGTVRTGAHTSRLLTLSNQGQETLVISDITISADEWTLDVNLPLNLASLDTTTVRVWFHSDIDGDYTGTLSIESNDPDLPQADIPLSATTAAVNDDLGTEYWYFHPSGAKIVALRRYEDINGDGVPEVLVADDNYGLYCVNGNASSEAEALWEFHTDIPEIGNGSIYDERGLTTIEDLTGDDVPDVIIGTAWSSRSVFALDGVTGEMLWFFDTDVIGGGGWVYQVDAAFDYTGDGTPDVLACCGDDGNGTGPRGVFCIDGTNGSQVWYNLAGVAVGGVRGVEDLTGDDVPDLFSGTSPDAGDAQVKLHNGATGTPVWQHDTGNMAVWALAPIDDINGDEEPDVTFGTFEADLFALDSDGNQLWVQPATSGIVSRLDVIDWGNQQYILPNHIGRANCQLHNAADGVAVWSASLGGNFLDLSPIGDINGDGMFDVMGGTLGNNAGVLSGSNGAVLWQSSYGAAIDQTGAAGDIDDNGSTELLVGTRDGWVFCYSGGPDGGGMTYEVTFDVTTDNGGSAEGAEVTMVGQNTSLQYAGTADDTGHLVMYSVVEDTYDITATLAGYSDWSMSSVFINGPASIDIELEATLPPPTDVTGTVEDNTVTLTWTDPQLEFLGVHIVRDGETVVEDLWDDGSPYVIPNHPNGTFTYALSAVYTSGVSADVEVEVTVDYNAAGEDPPAWATALVSNSPNPFNPTTTFAYSLAQPADVELRLYNARGQLVRVLRPGHKEAGLHHLVWDGTAAAGTPASSGVYLARLYVDKTLVQCRKCLLLK